MSSKPDQQVPLEVTRGMLVAIVVVIGISWFGGRRDRQDDGPRGRSGHAFGSWTTPDIMPILDDTAQSEWLGLRIDAVKGFAFFLVDHPEDGQGPSTVSFINRNESILGEIKAFDPSNDVWPPQANDFGQVVNFNKNAEGSEEQVTIDLGPISDFRLQVQTVLYDDTRITWASPRKHPAWPLRIHIGKCELGGETLLISVYEMQARTPSPDYEDGPIAALAAALRPL